MSPEEQAQRLIYDVLNHPTVKAVIPVDVLANAVVGLGNLAGTIKELREKIETPDEG